MSGRVIKPFTTREGPLREIANKIQMDFMKQAGPRVFDDSRYVEIDSTQRLGVYVAFQSALSDDAQQFDEVLTTMSREYDARFDIKNQQNKVEGFFFVNKMPS